MALQRQMESSQQRQMRLQDISAHKSNLFTVGDTLKEGYNLSFCSLTFYSCDFHEGRQHFITLLMLVLNFAF